MQLDLLAYPMRAGAKERTTSLEAANGIEASGKCARLREAVLKWFKAGREATADECAHAIGEDILNIRPRVTELYQRGLLQKTGKRGTADGGRSAHVWRIA